MDNKMKFSQWSKALPYKNLKFRKFCQFKELDEETLVEMSRLRITPNGEARPEFRKVPHLLDGFMLGCLAQIPQSLWAEALVYFQDHGIYEMQQKMKDSGIKVLRRTQPVNPQAQVPQAQVPQAQVPQAQVPQAQVPEEEQGEPYLGITGGTPEEQQKYDEIRKFLEDQPPYVFITLAKNHKFLIVSSNKLNPISYMYMKIDNSANDALLQQKSNFSKIDRDEYLKQGHGLHSEFLNTFDPKEEKTGKYTYHIWQGYRGLNQVSASKWLANYYDNLKWYNMASNSDIDDPKKAQRRREDYEAIRKDPTLLHPRMKQSGKPPRRESALPIISGAMLQQDIASINKRRNYIVKQYENDFKKLELGKTIEIYPDGRTNIEIGIASGHNNVFNMFKIPLQQANQIKQLLQNPNLTQLATEAGNFSTSEYIAEKVGLERKQIKNLTYTPKQVVDAIVADNKKYDACIYPFWDEHNQLHSSQTEGHHQYVQSKIQVAPEKFIPKDPYVRHHLHQLLSTAAEEVIESGKKFMTSGEQISLPRANFEKFLRLFRIIPEIKPEASEDGSYSPDDFPTVIRTYAQQLINADLNKAQWPNENITQELINAGIDLNAISNEAVTEARLNKDPSEKKKHKPWGPLIDGMELALLARAFKYWMQYQKGRTPEEFNLSVPPKTVLPTSYNKIIELLHEFIAFNNKRADHIVQNTKTANQFDYTLNFIHGKKEQYWPAGWDMAYGDPRTVYGLDEDSNDFIALCDEGWVFLQSLAAVRNFLTGNPKDAVDDEENPRHKSTAMQNPMNRRILIELDNEIAGEALSEFKHSKSGIISVANYIRLRRQLEQEGGKIDPATGKLSNIDPSDPVAQSFEKAKEGFQTTLKMNANNFVKRLWQLDLGYGSRRTVGRGPKIQSGGEMIDTAGSDSKISGRSKEQLEAKFGAACAFFLEPPKSRSLEERGPESKGQIFSSSLRRQNAEADAYVAKVEKGLAEIEQETGVQLKRDPKNKVFMDEVMRLVQSMHTSRKKILNHIVEVAMRQRYHELKNAPNASSMTEDKIIEDAKKYGRLKVFAHLQQLDKIQTLCPTMDVVAQKMGDRWKVLNKSSKQILSDMQYRIEKDFFDKEGNLTPTQEEYFKEYLKILKDVASYAQTGNVPYFNEDYVEIKNAIREIRDELERAQSPKAKNLSDEQKASFRLGLRRFIALFTWVLRNHITAIVSSRNNDIETDLKSLSDDKVLTADIGWLATAENILKTKHHYGQPIPLDLLKHYEPSMQKAINIARQRAA